MVPYVPGVSGISTRCRRKRTERNGDTRSKYQNFTHHLAAFVVPPALLVMGITPRPRTGFPVDQELGRCNLPEHFFEHFLTMARLHAASRGNHRKASDEHS